MNFEFKYVTPEYRPIPFWSWNEKLEEGETRNQINEMNDVGIGGFFMHARGGLQTEYLSEEWFNQVEAACDEANKLNMHAWAYDENGWPSGFGSGVVNGLGIDYQQKYLRMSTDEPTQNLICKCGDHYFYYDVNPFYVDTLDKKVIAKFIEVAYQPYYDRFKGRFDGFFTDEPQVSRNGIPWSFVFEREYNARYGQDIKAHLEELFLPVGEYKATRVNFWRMVTELFSSAFSKQIGDWCRAHNLKLTGHLVLEDHLNMQVTSNGACMPSYEYFDIPGIDKLGRSGPEILLTRQCSSVAEQMGKDQVLSETFALCGHNTSFARLKGIYEWQMVRGINLLCQHLEGYSLRGIRKRDYPPAMFKQQPWWCEYRRFVDAMARTGMILSKGEKRVDMLVLHPQTTVWSIFDIADYTAVGELEKEFQTTLRTLEAKHCIFHLGDEIVMERHARVENGKLIIGKQAYSTIINPCCEVLLPNTQRLLDEFTAQGGKIITIDEAVGYDVIDNPTITYARRILHGQIVHYFVNTSPNRVEATIKVDGSIIDPYTGDKKTLYSSHSFEPWGSLIVIEDGSKAIAGKKPMGNIIRLNPNGKIGERPLNALTLDFCEYYFDGELQEQNGYILNVCERANALERPVKIKMNFHVVADYVPDKLYLALETPNKLDISINGVAIDKKDVGYYRDRSFRKIDISNTMCVGDNVITIECDFAQSEEFYKARQNAYIFESELNKLVYDMELEAMYLLGDFGVETIGNWEDMHEREAFKYDGGFKLVEPRQELNLRHIERQGFPFFSGELVVDTTIDITNINDVLEIDPHGINALRVRIGGIEKVMVSDNRLSLEPFGLTGKQNVRITIINNLRNLLGPHHRKNGDSGWGICPGDFFKEPCVWNRNPGKNWDDKYTFVETGI